MVAFHNMGMPSFDLAGQNSLSKFKIKLTSKPIIPTAQARAEKVVVAGRDSFLTFTDGTYDNIQIEVGLRIRVLERDAQKVFDDIDNWLMSVPFVDRNLQFSHYPDDIYTWYETKPFAWEYFPPTGEYFTKVVFECRPFKKNNPTAITLPTNGTMRVIDYRGKNAPSAKLVIKGTGIVRLTCQDLQTKRSSTMECNIPQGFYNANLVFNLEDKIVSTEGGTSLLQHCKGNFPHLYPNRQYNFGVTGAANSAIIYLTDKKQ